MKTRYEMGVMDLYPVISNKTLIENNPFLQVKFKEEIDAGKLYRAVRLALENHPLFRCTLRYEKGYVMEENDGDFIIFEAAEKDRPLSFGDNTNGYLWQLSYSGKTLSFEWCHAVSDGKGGYAFFTDIICNYFGVHSPVECCLEPGLEGFYNKEEKGLPQKKQEKGFKASDLPYIKRGYKTDCHILKAPMQQVLTASRKSDSSPAAVLPPLFSMAMRKYIKTEAKNKNVCCNVVIDCRGPMKRDTMHNCIITKNITYIDRFDSMDFSLVSTIYRAILDLAMQEENIVAEGTKTVDMIKPIVSVRPLFLQKAAGKLFAAALKHADSNFTFTYLGRMNLPEQVMEKIEDFNFRSWTNFGECNIAAVDFGGMLIMNICENYEEKQIVPEFIKICEDAGIHFTETENLLFEQANLRMKGI